MRQTFIIVIFGGLCSCSKTDNKSGIQHADSSTTEPIYTAATLDEYKEMYELKSYLSKIDGSKVETVDFDCAILVYPDDKQIDEMKEVQGEDFYTVADDFNWYQGMAIEMIDSVGVKKMTASGQYLRLKGQNKSWDLDLRKENLPAWNLIFFKRTKEPRVISAIDLTVAQVKEYFEIAD